MKVKLLRNILVDHNYEPTPAGTVVDIPDDRAKFYLQNGLAEDTSDEATVTVHPDPVVGTGGERSAAPVGTPTIAADRDRMAVGGTAASTGTTGAGAGITVANAPGKPEPVITTGDSAVKPAKRPEDVRDAPAKKTAKGYGKATGKGGKR